MLNHVTKVETISEQEAQLSPRDRVSAALEVK